MLIAIQLIRLQTIAVVLFHKGKEILQLLHGPKNSITWPEMHHYKAHKTSLHGLKYTFGLSYMFSAE